jgi:RTX calcium-binding nonapeptide repeat (4 copies)
MSGAAFASIVGFALCLVPAAAARTRCAYTGEPDNVLTVTADRGALAEIIRRGERILVRELLERAARCAGGVPTVRNTDTIRVELRSDADFLDVYMAGGPFAPGATPEPEGASEIEVEIVFGGPEGGLASVHGTRRADEFQWGPGPQLRAGLNLNSGSAGDADVDLTVQGGLTPSLTVDAGAGDDVIAPAPGPPFLNDGAFVDGEAGDDRLVGFQNSGNILIGGDGDDVLTGGDRADHLIAFAGDDRISGGAGRDLIDAGLGRDVIRAGPGRDAIFSHDAWRDRVRCGAGRDRVAADRRDRLRGCEVVSR